MNRGMSSTKLKKLSELDDVLSGKLLNEHYTAADITLRHRTTRNLMILRRHPNDNAKGYIEEVARNLTAQGRYAEAKILL